MFLRLDWNMVHFFHFWNSECVTESFCTLTKAKLWERSGNFWAICDPYVALIWDGQMVVWHWYGVIFCSFPQYGKYMGWKLYIRHNMEKLWGWLSHTNSIPIQIFLVVSWYGFHMGVIFLILWKMFINFWPHFHIWNLYGFTNNKCSTACSS